MHHRIKFERVLDCVDVCSKLAVLSISHSVEPLQVGDRTYHVLEFDTPDEKLVRTY